MGTASGKFLVLPSMALPLAVSAQASITDDIAFIKSQIRQLESAGIDAGEMRAVLAQMEAEQAAQAGRAGQTPSAEPQQATSVTLLARPIQHGAAPGHGWCPAAPAA